MAIFTVLRFFTKVDAIAWWIDYGATTHVCKDRCWFKTYEPMEDGSVHYMDDDHFTPVHGKGSMALEFSSGKTITLFNELYVPKHHKNLVYVPMLNKHGYKQVYEFDKYILSKSGVFVGFGYYNNGYVHYKRMLEMSKDDLIPAIDENIRKYTSYRGGEYYDPIFFQSVGIIHETTAPYTPEQNGVAKRKNRALKEIVNSMLSYSSLSEGFWGEAMAVVRLPAPKRKTLDEKGIDCIFVGYAECKSAFTYTSISSNSDGPSWGIPLMNAGELPRMDPYEEGSDETKPFEEDKIAVTPPPPRHRGARISVRPQTPMAASTQALIDAFSSGSSLFPLPPTSPAYDQAQLGHRAAMIRRRDDIFEEDMPPRRRFALTGPPPGCDVAESSAVAAAAKAPRSQYNFVDTVEVGQGLIRSPGHDTRTIARAADRADDVGCVRALQASERRMMTSIEEINLRVSYQVEVCRKEGANFYTHLLDAQTDRRDIRLEIDVVRGQRTAYETELQEVHQAYLSSEAQNRALLARLETLETHMSRMEWKRQSAEDLAVTQMMRIHTLEVRARADTVEDADSSC
nr:zinc finger, CCHC-type [Tanacetum cinerariifolium]